MLARPLVVTVTRPRQLVALPYQPPSSPSRLVRHVLVVRWGTGHTSKRSKTARIRPAAVLTASIGGPMPSLRRIFPRADGLGRRASRSGFHIPGQGAGPPAFGSSLVVRGHNHPSVRLTSSEIACENLRRHCGTSLLDVAAHHCKKQAVTLGAFATDTPQSPRVTATAQVGRVAPASVWLQVKPPGRAELPRLTAPTLVRCLRHSSHSRRRYSSRRSRPHSRR